MARKNDNKEVNVDQSAKSRAGTENNLINKEKCILWENGEDKIYIDSEFVTIVETPRYLGMVSCIYQINMDQVIVAACLDKKEAIVVHIDGTTSFRGERVTTKANEGAVIAITERHINDAIMVLYPHLTGFKFVHTMAVILPDVLTGKNPEKEERDALSFFIGVNYKVTGKYVTEEHKVGMDCAMKISDLFKSLDEIITNQHDYIIDKLTVAYVWIKNHSDDYAFMPTLELNDISAQHRPEHLIWCLENRPTHYNKRKVIIDGHEAEIDPLANFLIDHNIRFDKKTKTGVKRQLAIEYVGNTYPTQKEFSMLSLVDKEFNQLRKIWSCTF
jgi:hypothetical protein